MIHGAGHSSYECKVLGEFGTKYSAAQYNKDRGSDPIPRKGPRKNSKTTLFLKKIWMNFKRLNPKK